MRKLAGLFTFTAGVVFAVLAFSPGHFDPQRELAEHTAIAAAPVGYFEPSRGAINDTPPRSFSPKYPLVAPGTASNTPRDRPVARVANLEADGSWQTVVTKDAAAVPNGARLTSAKPGDSTTRYELVLSIQRELKRAGCYAGSVNGSWTAATKRAMSHFMESVNASLPVDEPDYILHTLLKGHEVVSCSSACPQGLVRASDGRCIPNAVLAQNEKPAATGPDRPSATTRTGGTQGFKTTVAVNVPKALQADTSAIPLPSTTTSLPGRMAIGGPDAKSGPRETESGAWRIQIVPAKRPNAPASGNPKPGVQPSTTEIAALEGASPVENVDREPGAEFAEVDTNLRIPSPTPSRASRTDRTRVAALAPPVLSGTAVPRGPPAFAPRKSRPSAARKPSRRVAYGTRSVRNIFANPLGVR